MTRWQNVGTASLNIRSVTILSNKIVVLVKVTVITTKTRKAYKDKPIIFVVSGRTGSFNLIQLLFSIHKLIALGWKQHKMTNIVSFHLSPLSKTQNIHLIQVSIPTYGI